MRCDSRRNLRACRILALNYVYGIHFDRTHGTTSPRLAVAAAAPDHGGAEMSRKHKRAVTRPSLSRI